MSEMMDLHGVRIPAHEYTRLKKISEVFFGLTSSATPDALARKWSVLTAQRVLAEAEPEALCGPKAMREVIKRLERTKR